MRRWIIAAVVLGVLVLATATVWADPINVGGNCVSGPSSLKATPLTGKAVPRGVPFDASRTTVLLTPINVGGN